MLGFTSELIFEEKKTYTLADIILHKYIDVLHNQLTLLTHFPSIEIINQSLLIQSNKQIIHS